MIAAGPADDGITARLESVRARIAAAARRARRDPDDVTLIGITKTVPIDRIRQAVAAGLASLGENRVQEAETKIPSLPGGIAWHLVGHLQANKARRAVALFSVVHSVDSVDLARRLDRMARESGRRLDVLLQVDLAGETTKHGLPVDALEPSIAATARLDALRLRGLMIIPPPAAEPEGSRRWFRRLREIRDRLARSGPPLTDLSMGMTDDFEVAVEEGATMVRVGRALFGERPAAPPGPGAIR